MAMSVINRINVYTHCNDLGGKVWNPAITWTKKYAVFVSIENEQGVTGLGECWCFDASPDVLIAYLKTEVCPYIIGAQTDECDAIYQRLLSKATLTARHGLLASAWSGIDIALWDIRSTNAGLPLWQFLATHTANPSNTTDTIKQSTIKNGSIELYASGGLYGKDKTTEDLVNEMISMQSDGFRIVKMKIGGLAMKQDIDRINTVLAHLNANTQLIIDGVYTYTIAKALQLFNQIPTERIEAFQSPLPSANLAGMRTIRIMGIPVMATEAEYRSEIHQQLIQTGAVKFLQSSPIACGGISRLLQLTEQLTHTSEPRIKLSLEVSSTAVAFMAAAHYAAAHHDVEHVEYHYVHQVFFDQLALIPVPNHVGRFSLPDTVGLGISLPTNETHLMFSHT